MNDILKLEKMAEEILELKNSLRHRRPIIIEFCGSPKAGKTSCINSLNLFLKRNDFRTAIVTEKAGICPIKDKHSPIFNIWTATSMINEMNALIDNAKDIDIIICDRGVFDAICWFNWMYKKENLDKEEYDIINNFITLERWSKRIDLVYVFITEPKVSIDREYAHLLTRKPGRIMNEKILTEYKESIQLTIESMNKKFRVIELINTSELGQDELNKKVTVSVLDKLKEILMERIGYIDKELLFTTSFSKIVNDFKNKNNIDHLISLNDIYFGMREDVEANNDLIQIVPIAVITDKKRSKILILKKQKKASNNSPEKDSYMIWAGGHMRDEDKTKDMRDFLSLVKSTLKREVEEELGISITINKNPYFIYSTKHEKSKKHLAVCYIIERDIDDLKLKIDSYELVQNKGMSKSGTFIKIEDLFFNPNEYPLEPWSREILKNIFSIKIDEQLTLNNI